jgi:hypothetical protein
MPYVSLTLPLNIPTACLWKVPSADVLSFSFVIPLEYLLQLNLTTRIGTDLIACGYKVSSRRLSPWRGDRFITSPVTSEFGEHHGTIQPSVLMSM